MGRVLLTLWEGGGRGRERAAKEERSGGEGGRERERAVKEERRSGGEGGKE